jgi:hypothetical protein
MKKKKINKIIKKVVLTSTPILLDIIKKEREVERDSYSPKSSERDTGDWLEYDIDNSDKFNEMITNLLNYKEGLNIRIYNNSISINTDDIKNVKTTSTNSRKMVSDDNRLEIEIIKSTGFTINQGYIKRTGCKDENMFDTLLPSVKKVMLDINRENFNYIWNEIMIESGIMRDINLQKLVE